MPRSTPSSGNAPPGKAPSPVALLGACCVFLSTVEYLIPKPLPFIRIGLANLPLLIALEFPGSVFAALVFVKVASQAFFSGTLFSFVFLFSLCGSLVSACVMFALRRLFPVSMLGYCGISVCGAFASNFSQIVLARFLVLGPGAALIAPPLLAAGFATGLALGLFAEKFTRVSLWYKTLVLGARIRLPDRAVYALRNGIWYDGLPAFLLTGAVSLLLVLAPSLEVKLALFAASWIAAAVRRRSGRIWITFVMFAGITAFHLISPYGKVLAEFGPVVVTEGALRAGLAKAAVVQGLLFISRSMLPQAIPLPGRAGALLAETLAALAVLTAEKKSLSLKDGISGLDALLLRCSGHTSGV